VSSALAKRLSRALVEIQGNRMTQPNEVPRNLKTLRLPPPSRQELGLDSPGGSNTILPPGEVLWLPRLCALTEEGWVQTYISDGRGVFKPGGSIRMPEQRWRQFRQSATLQAVSVGDMSQEECAWCGATCRGWNGPVFCTQCHALLCFGRTTITNYFYCRPSCGNEGQLQGRRRDEFGFMPALQCGGHPSR
jgi:hypothetical protein